MRRLSLPFICVLLTASSWLSGQETRPTIPADLITKPWIEYFGVYMDKKKVGWFSLACVLFGNDRVDIQVRATFTMAYMGEATTMRMRESQVFSIKPPYDLLSGEAELTSGSTSQRVVLTRKDDALNAVITTAGQTRSMPVPAIKYSLWDILATYIWFRGERKPGEKLMCRSFELSELEETTDTSAVLRKTRMRSFGVPITVYETAATNSKIGPMGTHLFRKNGQLISGRIGNSLEIRLEPKQMATNIQAVFDVYVAAMAPCNRAIGDPKSVKELVVKISGQNAAAIQSGPRQTVVPHPGEDSVTVRIGPTHAQARKATDDEVRKSVQERVAYPIRNPKIVALAKRAVAGAKSPRERVERLVKFVDAYIADTVVLEPQFALDIVRTRRGDCSEHSLLFVVLARALGIPCREVAGLVYAGDDVRAFAGHAWNEVVIDGQWVEVDSSWGEIVPNATHIRFMADMEQAQIILPKFTIQVLSIKR